MDTSLPLLQWRSVNALFVPCVVETDGDLTSQLFRYAFSKPIPNEDHVVLHPPSLLRVTGTMRLVFDKDDLQCLDSFSWFGVYFRFTIKEIQHQEWASRHLIRWAQFEGMLFGLLMIALPIAFCIWLPLHFKKTAP